MVCIIYYYYRCIIKFFSLFGVAMGREIRLRATSYCSRSRFLYSAGTSYVFCRVIKFFKFSVAFFQGHPTDRFGKLSVRNALNPLQFSKGNFHLELS